MDILSLAAILITAEIFIGLSLISMVGSIVIWNIKKSKTAEERAHAERFGIFIGLWAPTFFLMAVLRNMM